MEVSSSSLVLITSDHGPSVVLNVYFNGTAFNFSKSEKQREKKKERKCSEKVDNRRWKKKIVFFFEMSFICFLNLLNEN